MSSELDQFYLRLNEPTKSCFLALRKIILQYDTRMGERWKYKIPFFYFAGKPFCYLWKDKKSNEPYIGITKGNLVNHSALYQGNRKKMKILPIPVNEDIDIELIFKIFNLTKQFYL